jgi:hypothetical protein
MLGNYQSPRNFEVLQAAGNRTDKLFFMARRLRSVIGLTGPDGFDLGEGDQQTFEFFHARPDLPFVD